MTTTPELPPRRIPWMLIFLVPRVAFYGFMAFRLVQLMQTNQVHGAEKQQLIVFLGVAIVVIATLVEGTIWGVAALVVMGRKSRYRVEEQKTQYAAALENQAKEIANEPLLPIEVPGLVLQTGESCYLRERAHLYALQTLVQRRGNYGGASVRVPGTHGALRLSAGSFASRPANRTAMGHIAEADVLLTNRRILVLTPAGNSSHALADIVSVTPFTDGAQIDFSHGKPLLATTGSQRFGLIVQRVLHEKA